MAYTWREDGFDDFGSPIITASHGDYLATVTHSGAAVVFTGVPDLAADAEVLGEYASGASVPADRYDDMVMWAEERLSHLAYNGHAVAVQLIVG